MAMDYKKLFGYGALIWAAAYLVAMLFIVYGLMESISIRLVVEVVVAVVVFIVARRMNFISISGALKYSVPWAVIAAILDLIWTFPFTGSAIYSSWDIWVGYALIILVPLLTVKKLFVSTTPSV